MAVPYADRTRAGHELGRHLTEHLLPVDAGRDVVLGLPRGGVPVAAKVAAALHASLDVLVVRKLGVPHHPELAMGAIASGDVRVLDHDLVRRLGVDDAALEEIVHRERDELVRRERAYRGDREAADVYERRVVLVDDGLATGSTMRAAAEAVRLRDPAEVVVAVPVAPPDTCRRLEEVADRVVCLATPARFGAVGAFYTDFAQTTDEEVQRLIQTAVRR